MKCCPEYKDLCSMFLISIFGILTTTITYFFLKLNLDIFSIFRGKMGKITIVSSGNLYLNSFKQFCSVDLMPGLLRTQPTDKFLEINKI